MKIAHDPAVTVLMPVYNCAEHIVEAMESILAQTFTDFELLIVNDGSTDDTRKIIASKKDRRIRLIDNESNRGLVPTLNKGLNRARGRFIARMDCDDVALPDRFLRQVKFLEDNPDVSVCGTWARVFGNPREATMTPPVHPEEIRVELLFRSALVHSSVMVRRRVLDNSPYRYDPAYRHAEDYDLWARLSRVTRLANIDEILMMYRVHEDQIGCLHQDEQQFVTNSVRERLLCELGISPTPAELQLHAVVADYRFPSKGVSLVDVERWLRRIVAANRASETYASLKLRKNIGGRWWRACRAYSQDDKSAWIVCFRSPLARATVEHLAGRFASKNHRFPRIYRHVRKRMR